MVHVLLTEKASCSCGLFVPLVLSLIDQLQATTLFRSRRTDVMTLVSHLVTLHILMVISFEPDRQAYSADSNNLLIHLDGGLCIMVTCVLGKRADISVLHAFRSRTSPIRRLNDPPNATFAGPCEPVGA